MSSHRRAPWALELLEDRACPSIALSFSSGNLSISGTPLGALKITGQGASNFKVTDGTVNYGTYSNITGNVTVTLARATSDVEIDLRGSTIGGSVTIDLGLGHPITNTDPAWSTDVYDSLATAALGAGTIRGSLTMKNGNGRERFDVGGLWSTGPTYTDLPVTVRGNLTVNAKVNTLGSDVLQVGRGTNVRGAIITTEVDQVTVGNQGSPVTTLTAVSGPVSVSTSQASLGTTAVFQGRFASSITVNALAPTPNFNSFTLEPEAQFQDTTVAGAVNVMLGQAQQGNVFSILDGANGEVTHVGGNVTLTSQSGAASLPDFYFLQGSIDGLPGSNNLTVNLAAVGSQVILDATALVLGNFAVNGGTSNGDNTVTVTGTVNNNLSITLGNGDNQGFISQTVGGTITWNSGSGADALTITADGVTTLSANFGAGDDTFTYAPATGGAIGCPPGGVIDGGADFDTYVEGANASHLGSFNIQNFEA